MSDFLEQLSVMQSNVEDSTGMMRALERALDRAGPAIAPVSEASASTALAALAPEQPLESDEIAVVLPTSGSTGVPKGVLLSAGALAASATATVDRLGGPGRWLLALPPSRVAGLQVLVRSIVSGVPAPVGLELPGGHFGVDAFVAGTRRLVESAGSGAATGGEGAPRRYTALVPTQLARLLDAGGSAVAALREYDAVLVGGGAAGASLLRRARESGVAVVTTYGSTETCGGCVYDGAPLDGVSVSLESDGRIRISGEVLFSGYRLDPEATTEALVDGWFRTADLGRVDDEGRLAVLGRTDDVVISGGVNVPLPAVEDAVRTVPAVADCAALGVPDPAWGDKVVAFVAPRPGASAPTLAEVRDAVAALQPREYAPRKLVVLSELPMLESGKVNRMALRSSLG